MKHIIPTLLCACALTPATAVAQTDVQPFKLGVTTEGVAYYLPRTAVRIVITATKTEYTPGTLQPYAARYLMMKDVPAAASTTWAIDNIDIQPYGVPDDSKAFNIALKSKTIAPLVCLTDDGRLMSVNTHSEETALPPVPKGVEGKNTLHPQEYMTRDMLAAGSAAKQAELVAQEIYDIRESRSALARGEAENMPKDGAQLKLMFDMLQQQEDALTSLFCGIKVTSTVVKVIDYTPEEEGREVLLRFSRHLGFTDHDDLAGDPVYITTTALEEGREQAELTKDEKKKLEKSLRVNVAARTRIGIGTVKQELKAIETPMAQFGHIKYLGDLLFDKNSTVTLTVNPTTGGIIELTAGEDEKKKK